MATVLCALVSAVTFTPNVRAWWAHSGVAYKGLLETTVDSRRLLAVDGPLIFGISLPTTFAALTADADAALR